jgi:hypothetical protein
MTAVALSLAAGAASAAEWAGTITDIDETANHIVVRNEARPDQQQVFAVSDTNTVGATTQDLQEGDQVSIFYATPGGPTGGPINAMRISKVGEEADAAQMGDTTAWRGSKDRSSLWATPPRKVSRWMSCRRAIRW